MKKEKEEGRDRNDRKLMPEGDVQPAPASPAGDQERCQQRPPREGFSGKCLRSPPENSSPCQPASSGTPRECPCPVPEPREDG